MNESMNQNTHSHYNLHILDMLSHSLIIVIEKKKNIKVLCSSTLCGIGRIY